MFNPSITFQDLPPAPRSTPTYILANRNTGSLLIPDLLVGVETMWLCSKSPSNSQQLKSLKTKLFLINV